MQQGNFKNTVVLKNIPSNLIEEAIIVFKENKKAWKLQKIENGKNSIENTTKPIKKDYIVKEAELIVNQYVDGIENKGEEKTVKNIQYKRLKKYAYFTTIMLLIQFFVNILN